VLSCDPLTLKLDGLDLLLEVDSLPLIRKGIDFRPDPLASTASEVVLRLGSSGGPRSMRIGPIILNDANATISFVSGDKGAIGYYRSDFGFASGDQTGDETAFWLGLAATKRIGIDFKQKKLICAPGTVECRLKARKDLLSPQTARFRNDDPIPIDFADIVAGNALACDLALVAGDTVSLNVDIDSGAPAVELLAGRLTVNLERAGKVGAIVRSVGISPAQGECRFRFNAVRNSRNRAEIWTSTRSVPLGFRPPAKGVWHSPLLAPPRTKARSPVQLSRREDLVQAGGTATLPLHSWFGSSQFDALPQGASALLVCSRKTATPAGVGISWLDPLIQFQTTRPWLHLSSGAFVHNRPGNAFRGADSNWRFAATGKGGSIPLLRPHAWTEGVERPARNSPLDFANDEVNGAFADLPLASPDAVHETGLADRTSTLGAVVVPPKILGVIPDGDIVPGEVRLESHTRLFEMATPRLPNQLAVAPPPPLSLTVAVPNGAATDYAVAWPALQDAGGSYPWVWISTLEEWAANIAGIIDPEAPIAVGDLIGDKSRPVDFPLAILKSTRALSLEGILDNLSSGLKGNAKTAFDNRRGPIIKLIDAVDDSVLLPSWVGLIVFDAPLDFDAFPMLKAVIPSDKAVAPRLSFLSVTPRDSKVISADPAISAALEWNNKTGIVTLPGTADQEGNFFPRSLSLAFRDRRLINFHSQADLIFYSFLGLKPVSKPPKKIAIIGSAKRVAGTNQKDGAFELRFEAEIADGERLVIFPISGDLTESSKTFIKTIWLRRVEIVDAPTPSGRKAEVEIDGSIEFQKPAMDFGYGDFFNSLRAIDFTGLRIALPDLGGVDSRLLTIQYPTFKFNLDLEPISLLGNALKLKINQLIIAWKGAGGCDFGQFPSLNLPNTGNLLPDLSQIVLRGQIDFGALPELFARSLSGFSLDGVFALNFDSNGLPVRLPYIGIGGFGFDRLDLDLLSFIRLKMDSLTLGPAPWDAPPNGAALTVVNATLEVVGVKLLDGGTCAFFSSDGDSGNGFWAAFNGVDLPFFKLEWGFVARNVDFASDLPLALLTPPPEQSVDASFGSISTILVDAWKLKKIRPAKGTTARGWTFAAGLNAFDGAFRGRALLQDGGFTGLALYGEALRRLLGWNFVFIGLYRKDITPGEDYFYFSVTLPPLTFGGIRYTGGTIAAEIHTSGDFMFDFGFPWRAIGGGRQWERTVGAIVTPGQASGGFYVRKRHSDNPVTGKKELTLAGGVAFQWGLGAAFGGGVFEVWVRIGIYVIVEGEITIDYDSINDVRIVAFSLQGAAGILLEGEGRIDWWVISVRVGIQASAEIRAALIWDGRPGADNRVLMPIEAELSVSAYAEACIGGGCARICRGIRVHIDIPVRYQLQFG